MLGLQSFLQLPATSNIPQPRALGPSPKTREKTTHDPLRPKRTFSQIRCPQHKTGLFGSSNPARNELSSLDPWPTTPLPEGPSVVLVKAEGRLLLRSVTNLQLWPRTPPKSPEERLRRITRGPEKVDAEVGGRGADLCSLV